MSIVVTTPTGQIGRQVVARLLAAGADLTLVARDAGRLSPAARPRPRVVEGALDDATLQEATRGAQAVFLVIPPDLRTDDWPTFQLGVGRAAADAAAANGVRRVVFVSSAGAQRDDLFAVSRLGEVERLLAAAVSDLTVLRAGFFFENFLAAVPTIAADGAVYMSLPPERRHPMVATRDIAAAAAAALLDDASHGHRVRGVHGAADVSPAEAVQAFSAALGRTVRYVQVPDAAMREGLIAAGASAHVADEYPRLMHGLGTLDYVAEPRTAETTTPTTVAEWARQVLAPAVAGVAAAPAAA
jgi:uncharacterized protein YbjT (DUF2867 family)